MSKGVTVWFTGLSGAGKTSISQLVEEQLRQRDKHVEVLDGDAMRGSLTADLGFSRQDRQTNIKRAVFVAKLLSRNDVIVLASFISPYREMRAYARQEIESFVEVYVKCSLSECIRRDVKGLYSKALEGKIKEFTGVSDPFEEPLSPDLVVDTEQETVEESAQKVLDYLQERGYLN